MLISNFGEVTRLVAARDQLLEARRAAGRGRIILTVQTDVKENTHISSFVEVEPLRQHIVGLILSNVEEVERELASLGVVIPEAVVP